MKAELEPLKGKYYGTEISIQFKGYGYKINLWNPGSFEPSERELKEYGYTVKDWEENKIVKDGWGGECRVRELDIVCDTHFESKETYELALEIVKRINESNKK